MLSVLASKQNLQGHMVVELCQVAYGSVYMDPHIQIRPLNMVAELCQSDNRSHVELIGGQLIETVCSHDILGLTLTPSLKSSQHQT